MGISEKLLNLTLDKSSGVTNSYLVSSIVSFICAAMNNFFSCYDTAKKLHFALFTYTEKNEFEFYCILSNKLYFLQSIKLLVALVDSFL